MMDLNLPDGKYIYFNSVRSGAMQLWRMKPDGSDQEQLQMMNITTGFRIFRRMENGLYLFRF